MCSDTLLCLRAVEGSVSPTMGRNWAAGRRCRADLAVQLVCTGEVHPRSSSSAPRSRRATRRPRPRCSTDYSQRRADEPRDANFHYIFIANFMRFFASACFSEHPMWRSDVVAASWS